jgi:hypothetical protein
MTDYEIVVDLQSFVMELPAGMNPEDIDAVREAAIKKIKEKCETGEIYLDSVEVDEGI